MDINLNQIIKSFREIESAAIQSIVTGSLSFSDLPEPILTQSICINAVFKNPEIYKEIPLKNKDEIVSLAASQLFANNLMLVPTDIGGWVSSKIHEPILELLDEKLKSEFLCEIAVINDYNNIKYLPDSLRRNFKFLARVVQQNPQVLSAMDESEINESLCEIAIHSENFTLKHLPASWITSEYCDLAFSKNYLEILNFPTQFISKERILQAINVADSKFVRSIADLIPDDLWDEELIIAVVKKDENIFREVPYNKISTELLFELAPYLNRYDTLYHVPQDVFTPNLNHRLIIENPLLLGGIPAEMRNRVLCFDAVTKDGLALQFVPKEVQTVELYRVAISNNGLALQYVPKPYKDEDLPMMAVKQNGEAIQYVPSNLVDELMCRTAVMNNPHAIYKIKPDYHTDELYRMALHHLPMVLKLIPVDKRTEEYCIMALRKDAKVYDFIPVHLRKNESIRELAREYGLLSEEEMMEESGTTA